MVCSALFIWKSLGLVSGSESPIVVVLSGSMEPAYYRGDLLFLTRYNTRIEKGEVVVYSMPMKQIPIVHRVLNAHQKKEDTYNSYTLLTKGDANSKDDRWGIYDRNVMWLEEKNIIGRARAFLPYIGILTIMLNDYPMLKWAMIGGLLLTVLLTRGDDKS